VRTLLDRRLDFVIGSRYVEGGTTSDDWGFLRWLNSRIATTLARPFTSVTDPMSGFFALRRSTFQAAAPHLEAIGYKIGLELIVKGRCRHVGEIPIHFEDRVLGESKLTLTQQLLYLRHLRHLAIFKFGVWSHLMQFLVVGALGVLVNLSFLTLFTLFDVRENVAVALAIFLSIIFNFILNRRFSFSYARSGAWLRQFVGYVFASAAGALLNYVVTMSIHSRFEAVPVQVAAIVGIATGTFSNFFFSRYLVFRVKHIRTKKS
jgi:dolichol-phosphate mannosyltransferase